jgi:uncharacterized membrane protein
MRTVLTPTLPRTFGSPERRAAPRKWVRTSVAFGYYVMALMKPATPWHHVHHPPLGEGAQRIRVERSATIDQAVDRVYEYVSTPENDPTWVPASLRHEMLSPAPMRVGSITEEDVWFLGRRMRYAWEVTQYEPPTAFALRSISGPIPATIRVLLESLDGARTKVILVAEVHLRGVYKPMELVMRWVARRQFGTQLRKLKNLLESEAFR